jgi:predicted RNA-binding Zn ribbon-like protein
MDEFTSPSALEKNSGPGLPFFFFGNQAALDFANTLAAVKDVPLDLMTDLPALGRWLVAAQLATPDQADAIQKALDGEASEALLARARDYRAEVKELVASLGAGRGVPARFVEATNRLLREAGAVLQVGAGEGEGYRRALPLDWPQPAAVLGRLAETGVSLLCDCDLSLVRKCENPRCVMVFYDTTKNHQRRWCSMEICGNRHKAALHRQKKKAQPEA